jgi:hypothetical protein
MALAADPVILSLEIVIGFSGPESLNCDAGVLFRVGDNFELYRFLNTLL